MTMKLFIRAGLIAAISVPLLAFAGISYYFSTIILTPSANTLEEEKAIMKDSWKTSYEEVMAQFSAPETFTTTSVDDITIAGWYFEHPADSVDCAVVLPHGYGRMRANMLKYAPVFWECGCDLVLYDHRAHNETGGDHPTAGIKEKMDLIAVTEWLQEKTNLADKQIAWMGESWGAATVLMAGALDKDVAFIVADSPYQDWHSAIFERAYRDYGTWVKALAPTVMWLVDMQAGVNHEDASPLEAADDIVEPVFLIHSQDDSATDSEQSVNIAKNLNPAKSEFHHTDWGSDHVMDVINRPDEYKQMIHDFIKKEVGTFGLCGVE